MLKKLPENTAPVKLLVAKESYLASRENIEWLHIFPQIIVLLMEKQQVKLQAFIRQNKMSMASQISHIFVLKTKTNTGKAIATVMNSSYENYKQLQNNFAYISIIF